MRRWRYSNCPRNMTCFFVIPELAIVCQAAAVDVLLLEIAASGQIRKACAYDRGVDNLVVCCFLSFYFWSGFLCRKTTKKAARISPSPP